MKILNQDSFTKKLSESIKEYMFRQEEINALVNFMSKKNLLQYYSKEEISNRYENTLY